MKGEFVEMVLRSKESTFIIRPPEDYALVVNNLTGSTQRLSMAEFEMIAQRALKAVGLES